MTEPDAGRERTARVPSSSDVIAAYEADFANVSGRPHAVAFAYARHALRLLIPALDIRPDDEVILSPLTCRVVPLALKAAGVSPVFADIGRNHLNLDATAVERAVTARTRAILFQHTYGSSTGIDDIAKLAAARQLVLIEDCAQCLPTGRAGHSGVAAIWSHNLRKPLPAGAGAFATLSDDTAATHLRRLVATSREPSARERMALSAERWVHHHWLRPERYWFFLDLAHRVRGSRRVMNLNEAMHAEMHSVPVRVGRQQAAWGVAALREVPARIEHRRRLADAYERAFTRLERHADVAAVHGDCLYYYPVLADDKPKLLAAARHSALELIAWPESLPIFPVQRESEMAALGYRMGDCPGAEAVARRLVGLPLETDITTRHAEALAALIQRAAGS